MASGRHLGEDQRGFAGILDTQSVKTISVGGIRGYDGAKKLSGRKRHLLVDTLSMVLKARVHSSNLQDRAAMPLVLESAQCSFGYAPAGRDGHEAQFTEDPASREHHDGREGR
jgi:hypothetical protein